VKKFPAFSEPQHLWPQLQESFPVPILNQIDPVHALIPLYRELF